jgi:8-hydroxy-5-deazaflavin:NADPH oxidoreductase
VRVAQGATGRPAEIVTAGRLRAVDAGSLRRARELEAVAFLETTEFARPS